MSEPTSTGADVVAHALAELGVRHAFGMLSSHNMAIFDAINRVGATRIVNVRHEGGGVHAADGYARATGELGVMIASTGPGTTNAVTGLYEAACASSKVLLITGQVDTRFYGKGLGLLHEAEAQLPMLRTVARCVESPRRVADLGPAIANVVRDIYSGRPQPGAIEIPVDLQYAEVQELAVAFRRPTRTALVDTAVDAAAQVINGATRRVILAGGGVIRAEAAKELIAFAEALDAPVVTTVNGRGSIPEDHALAIGNLYASRGMADALGHAEVLVAVGTRFQVGVDGANLANRPGGKLLHIDIDPGVIGRVHAPTVAIVADAKAALPALTEATISENDAQFNVGLRDVRDGVRSSLATRIGPDYETMMQMMRDAVPRDAVIVRDTTVAADNFGNQLLPIYEPRTSMHPTSAAIGLGLPLGVGAAIGSGRRALVIAGDGGLMLHASELATAAQYSAAVTVVVFNDGGYGSLRALQASRFEGRIGETDLGFVDFVKLAESVGVEAARSRTIAEFEAALATGVGMQGPYLIEVDMRAFEPMKGSLLPAEKP